VKTKAELKRLKELERASTGWPPSSDVEAV
jgi:hypothetical protein